MILADTSAWVEYDRATGSAVDTRLTRLIGEGGPVAVTEPVIIEVLAGARDDRRGGRVAERCRAPCARCGPRAVAAVVGIELDVT